MIKAIIFDCFGVLYVHHGPEYVKNYATDYDSIKGQLSDLTRQANYGLISQKEYELALAEAANLPFSEVHQRVSKGFARNEALVKYIKHQLKPSYKIALLSNISRGTMDKFFSNSELGELFDAVALSGEEGLIKPHPNAFLNICQKLAVDASEALMIDDSHENVLGAKSAGLGALHYDGLAHLKRSLSVALADSNN